MIEELRVGMRVRVVDETDPDFHGRVGTVTRLRNMDRSAWVRFDRWPEGAPRYFDEGHERQDEEYFHGTLLEEFVPEPDWEYDMGFPVG